MQALQLLQSDAEFRTMVERALVREPHVFTELVVHVQEELETLEGAVRYMNDELFAQLELPEKKREGQK
jgi:hypothetical protein